MLLPDVPVSRTSQLNLVVTLSICRIRHSGLATCAFDASASCLVETAAGAGIIAA